MKHPYSALLLAMLTATAVVAGAPQTPVFQAPALLIGKSGESREIRLVAATKGSFLYHPEDRPAETIEGKIPDDGTIFISEPQEFSRAMDLYQARKYEEAKAQFITVKTRFDAFLTLENSPAALAAFYEMECLRKLGDLEGLAAALQKFSKDPLTRETQLRQLELYVLWDAVRTKSWDRLDALARERANARLPGDQRAQVAYCHGLALEGLNRPEEALFAYQTAMTADSGASEDITRHAALRVLAIHKADPEVQNAIKLRGTGSENKNSRGYMRLTEAAAVTSLFELSLGAGTPLPAEYRMFLKYKPAD